MRQQLAALVAGLGLGAPLASAQTAVSEGEANADTAPVIPLSEALDDVAARFGVDFIYEQDLVRNVRVTPDEDARSAYEALNADEDLSFRFTSADAFTIQRVAPEIEHADLTLRPIDVSARSDPSTYEWYGALVLRQALLALRREGGIADASVEFRAYVWVDDAGRVERFAIDGLDSSTTLQDLVTRALERVQIGEAPPLNMPQPIGLSFSAQ